MIYMQESVAVSRAPYSNQNSPSASASGWGLGTSEQVLKSYDFGKAARGAALVFLTKSI